MLVCLSDLLDLHVYAVWILPAGLAGLAVGPEVVVNVPLLVERAMKGLGGTLMMTVIGRGSRRGYNREPHYDRYIPESRHHGIELENRNPNP